MKNEGLEAIKIKGLALKYIWEGLSDVKGSWHG